MLVSGLRPVTLAIEAYPAGPAVAVAKIVPYRDGGWAISVPFHAATSALVIKQQIPDDRIGTFFIPKSAATTYAAHRPVKLSYHASGLFQVSGAGIQSGTPGRLLIPKAFGVVAAPLATPVATGPSLGIGVWGLDEFVSPTGRSHDPVLTLDHKDVFEGETWEDPPNGFKIALFALPRRYLEAIDPHDPEHLAPIFPYKTGPRPVRVRILSWEAPLAFLGLNYFPARMEFSPLTSGYVLTGPRDDRGHTVSAVAPMPPGDVHPNLDYEPGAAPLWLGPGAGGRGVIVPPERSSRGGLGLPAAAPGTSPARDDKAPGPPSR